MRVRPARRHPAVSGGRRRGSIRLLLTLGIIPALLLAGPGCTGDPAPDSPAKPPPEPGQPEYQVGSSEHGYPLRVVDAAGNTLTLQKPPEKILSLVPSATRAIQTLGGGSHLVGRTEYDTDPNLAHLPSVGGGLEPNLEALASLEPDLVIRFAGESDPETPRRLSELGIVHFAVRLDRIADVERLFVDLGRILEAEEAAGAAVQEIKDVQGEIRTSVAGRNQVRVAYVLGGDPPWVAGSGTFIDELLVLAGGSNVFSDITNLYGPVSVETFLVREIDLVLAPEGVELRLPEGAFTIVRVSPNLELPGPDLARSALEVASILHPEAFR